MNENKILHVMILDKFLAPFINFVDEHFGRDGHHYVFITSEKYQYGLTPEHNVEFLYTDDDIFITLLEYMQIAKKIILHGLWRDKVDILLYFNQIILKKCYWFMWGGDFYFPETKSKIKSKIIQKMGYLVNVLENEYNLVKVWYKAEGRYIQSFGYPSNIFNHKKFHTSQKNTNTLYILIGNSATETNHHREIFKTLEKYKNENIKIFAPLSYGNQEYAKEIAIEGKRIFKNKFTAIFDFMKYELYFQFLSTIDIAIFAHNRSQGMGNTINLLGLGKKVYIKTTVTPWSFFKDKNIEIFDFEKIELSILDKKIQNSNTKNISSFFSEETLVKQLKTIFHIKRSRLQC